MTFLSIGPPNNPTIEVSFDYTNDPTSASFTWTDITPYVVSYSRSPVRTNEFDQPGAATATVVLRNKDARFTPDNASGPYYGYLKKHRRMRVRAQWAGVTYDRFWGYVVDWPQAWDDAGQDQTVTVSLVDAYWPTELYDLQSGSYSAALSGTAVSDVLATVVQDAGGSPLGSGSPILDAGISTVVASGTLPTGSYASQRLKDIAATEMGFMFADGAGLLQYHDRHHRLTVSASTAVQATIGDSSGQVRYTDPSPEFGDVWTVVRVTPSSGTVVQSATVTAGVGSYFPQVLNYPPSGQYLVSDATEAGQAAQYLSSRYASPVTKVSSVTALGARDSTMWPTLLGLDTSDLVVFQRRFLSNGTVAGTISLNQFVEGYSDDVAVGQDWRVGLSMSPADPQKYWIAESSTLGLAGTTTRGGY